MYIFILGSQRHYNPTLIIEVHVIGSTTVSLAFSTDAVHGLGVAILLLNTDLHSDVSFFVDLIPIISAYDAKVTFLASQRKHMCLSNAIVYMTPS